MYYAYANGICLIGKNIYTELIKQLKEEDVKRSILITTQIMFKDIRKSFTANASPYEVNKNIMRTFVGICMFDGLLDYKKIGDIEFFEEETN